MAIQKVGVVGCGLMGSGIAQVSAQAGFPTVVAEASQELLDRGLGGLRKNLDALAPRPSAMDEWEVQPDGSMKNKKTGIRITLMNPCPAGDMEHEFALAAYNRSKSRR